MLSEVSGRRLEITEVQKNLLKVSVDQKKLLNWVF